MGGYGINIPLTKDNNPENFRGYVYQEYPKMILAPCDKAYVEEWKNRNHYYDAATGRASPIMAAPKVGSMQPVLTTQRDVEAKLATQVNEPLIVRNDEEYNLAMKIHGLPLTVGKKMAVEVPISEDERDSELAKLRAENAKLKAAKPVENPAVKPKRKYTRRAKPAADPHAEAPE